jgi:hypothetical protein
MDIGDLVGVRFLDDINVWAEVKAWFYWTVESDPMKPLKLHVADFKGSDIYWSTIFKSGNVPVKIEVLRAAASDYVEPNLNKSVDLKVNKALANERMPQDALWRILDVWIEDGWLKATVAWGKPI